MNSPYKAAIFDLDGVVTDTAVYHYQAWKKIAKDLNIPFDHNLNDRLRGISRGKSLDIILDNAHRTLSTQEKNDILILKNDLYRKLLVEEMSKADILPGVALLLKDLKGKKIGIALASASRNAPFILQKLELTEAFDAVVDPLSVKAGKPAPDIFLKAAELLGIDPSECIGLEDAEAGIRAINSAGMLSVGIGPASRLSQAKLLLPDLKDYTLLINLF